MQITDTVLTGLNKVGLDSSIILSPVYDGASLMSGKLDGVQKYLQERLGHEIPYCTASTISCIWLWFMSCLQRLHFSFVT